MHVLAVAGDMATVAGVLLNDAEEPLDALLVVVVALALDDNLLAAVDELVAALLREVLLGKNALAVLELALGVVLVVLGNAVEHAIL